MSDTTTLPLVLETKALDIVKSLEAIVVAAPIRFGCLEFICDCISEVTPPKYPISVAVNTLSYIRKSSISPQKWESEFVLSPTSK